MIETYPLEKAAEAYARMMSGRRGVSRCADDVIASHGEEEQLIVEKRSFCPLTTVLALGGANGTGACLLMLPEDDQPRRKQSARLPTLPFVAARDEHRDVFRRRNARGHQCLGSQP